MHWLATLTTLSSNTLTASNVFMAVLSIEETLLALSPSALIVRLSGLSALSAEITVEPVLSATKLTCWRDPLMNHASSAKFSCLTVLSA